MGDQGALDENKVRSILSLLEQISQKFSEESPREIDEISANLKLALRAIEPIQLATASNPQSLAPFANDILTSCLRALRPIATLQEQIEQKTKNEAESSSEENGEEHEIMEQADALAILTLDQSLELEVELMQITGHLVKIFLRLPTEYPSVHLLVPAAPLAQDDEDEETEDEPQDESLLINLSADASLLHSLLPHLLSTLSAAPPHTVPLPASGSVPPQLHLKRRKADLAELACRLLPYLAALWQASEQQATTLPFSLIVQHLLQRLERNPVTNKHSAKSVALVLATLAKLVRYCPPHLVEEELSVLYNLNCRLLVETRETGLRKAFETVRESCIRLFVAVIYAMNTNFVPFARDFLFRTANVLKDPLVLTDCVYVLRQQHQLLQETILPKLFKDLIKASSNTKYDEDVLTMIIEALGRLVCYLGRRLSAPYLPPLVNSLLRTLRTQPQALGVPCVVALSRVLLVACGGSQGVASGQPQPQPQPQEKEQEQEKEQAGEGKSESEGKGEEEGEEEEVLSPETWLKALSIYLDICDEKIFEAVPASEGGEGGEAEGIPEDVVSQLQMCSLDMLKCLLSNKNFLQKTRSVGQLDVEKKKRYFVNALRHILRVNADRPIVYADDDVIREMEAEILALIE
eukprot:TRINITY_DN2463_c0_g2_i4.p1 TRINITY_DN2463_c0_g2~~TRINITY_DN2463_c0_g2_i4.p1  ORF type:complete len:655 (-),score=123.61 TRINITY_DN2463_c0_g2_i4:103-2010(-)